MADPFPLARAAVRAAVRAGADDAEAYLETGPVHRINHHAGTTYDTHGHRRELALRVWCGGRCGLVAGEDPDPAQLADRAVILARRAGVTSPPRLRAEAGGLPTDRLLPPDCGPDDDTGHGLIDQVVAAVTGGAATGGTAAVGRAAGGAAARGAVSAGLVHTRIDRVLVNSHGLSIGYTDVAYQLWVWWQTAAGHARAAASARRLADLRPDQLAADLRAQAPDLRGAPASVATGPCPVLLPPVAAADVARAVGGLLSGEHALGDLRPLVGKLGRRIAAPEVTLVDDGTLDGGVRTRPFDDEGTPGQPTVLLDRGRLRGFLHTLETADRLGVAPNGKAARSSLTHPPRPAPSNIYLVAGAVPAADLRAELRRGLLVTGFSRAGRVVASTGRFSAVAHGQWLEPGVAPQPVTRVPLSVGAFALLRNIRGCGDDLVFSPLAGGAGAPTLLLSEMVVG